MTLHQLRIFQAVATYLSETKAARDIRIRQPSVSKQLKLLEQELGVQLHVRKEQGVKLTEEGRIFLSAIEPVLEQIHKVRTLFAEKAPRLKPVFLKIAGSQSPSALMLPQAFNEFTKTHPYTHLSLRIAEAAIVEQMVLSREVEVGVITNPCTNPQLTAEFLCAEEVIAVVSSKHPFAKKRKVLPEELSKVPIVAKMGGRISDQLQKMGLRLNISMRCEPIDAMKAAVESGLGMGFFYRNTIETDLRKGYLKAIKFPLLKQIEVKWFVIYSSKVPLSHEAQEFVFLLHHMVSNPCRREVHTTVHTNQ